MNQSTRTSMRSGGVLALLLVLAPVGVWAQAAAPAPATAENTVKLETFTVTGTNIKRLDQENVLPVTVIDRAAMEARDATTPVQLLTALPQITNVPLNESTSGGANTRGDNANVNLRGIGSGNTLVLINGRRVAPHPATSPDAGALSFSVNVNQLPTQGVDRIDILRDGASSIYGSDAVAGVINYIMRREYQGTEVRYRTTVPEAGGGETNSFSVTHGGQFAGGKGRFVTTFDYLLRQAIAMSERDYSARADHFLEAPPPFNVAGSAFDGRSATSIWPSFRLGAGATSGPTNYFRPISGTPTLTTTAPTRTTAPEYYLNVNTYQNLGQTWSERVNWFNSFEYDLTERMTAFADISFYHADTQLVRQPLPFNAPSADQIATMSIDNPFNPFGNRFRHATGAPNADGTPRAVGTPTALTLLTHTIQDAGAETIDVSSGLYRIVAGVRGTIFDDWNWETAGLYTRAYVTDLSNNAIRESLFRNALMRTDATAYNPFGYTFKVQGGAVVADQPYTNPKSVMDTFVTKWWRNGFSSIASGDFRASGPVFNYWDNTVSLAVGGEFRKEEFKDHRPPYAGVNPPESGLDPNDNDFVQASPKPDSAGDRTVSSAYAEIVLPVVGPSHKLPFVSLLEFTGSVRFEQYSDFGNTAKPKFGLNWKPYKGMMVRASYNEGFTAPNLPTLYAPNQFTVDSPPGQPDPYRNPVTSEGNYVQRNYSTGNPNLLPVTSEGQSVGVVLEAPYVKGLTFTVDYWQLDQSNVIGSFSASQILNSDAAILNAYVQSQLAAGRTVDQIDLGSGTANYRGDPGITRFAPTAQDIATFAAYNAGRPTAQQRAVVGRILARTAAYQNLAKGRAAGVDFGFTYQIPWTDYGRFALSSEWTYLIESYQLRNIGANAAPLYIERLNVDGATRVRGNANLTWSKGQWRAGLSAYYIGKYADSGATTTAANYISLGEPAYLSKQFDSGNYLYRYVVEDSVSMNTFVSYRIPKSDRKWLSDVNVRLGIVNFTDEQPPLTPGAFGFSSSVYAHLFPGRTWTLDISKRF